MTSNYRASKDEIMSDLMTHIPTITSSTLYQQFGGGVDMEIKDMGNWVHNEQCSPRDSEVKAKEVICT